MLFKNLFDEQIEKILKILSPSNKKESYLKTKWDYEYEKQPLREWRKDDDPRYFV